MKEEVLRVSHFCIDNGYGHLEGASTDESSGRLIQDMNITLYKGQIIAIMGKSGVGKSLSMMSLLGLRAPQLIVSGQVSFCGEPLPIHQPDAHAWQHIRGRGISYLFQDAKNALNPLDTIKAAFDKVFSCTPLAKSAYQNKMIELLKKTHVYYHDLPHRYPHELSGGEAKRVHLALLLALNAKVIIADEPTGHLDDDTAVEVLLLLTKLAKQDGKAIIIISHDEQVVVYADEVMLLANGVCRRIHDKEPHGVSGEVFDEACSLPKSSPPSKLTNWASQNSSSKAWNHTHIQSSAHTSDSNDLLLSVKGVSYHYKYLGLFSKLLITNRASFVMSVPDFDVHQGQIIGIRGYSGIGKSSLAKLITRLDDALCAKGEMVFYDEGQAMDVLRLSKKALRVYRPKVVLMMQDYAGSLNPYLTIEMSMAEGLMVKSKQQKTKPNHKPNHKQMSQIIDDLLIRLNLPKDILQKYPHQLSGGQKARVCLARALLVQPKLLILDEPTAMLDKDNAWQMMQLLKETNEQFGTSMLIISHDDKMLLSMCDQVIEMAAD